MQDEQILKNLSVNNVYAERHFSERNDRCGDVRAQAGGRTTAQARATLRWSFSYRTSSLRKRLKPTVEDLDHPAARLLRRVALLGISFLATTDDMRDVAVRLDDLCAKSDGWIAAGALSPWTTS